MHRLLLVDDNSTVLDAIGLALSRQGYAVTSASTAEHAFEALTTADFDAILSDFRMPGHDGVWLLRQARRLQPHAVRLMLSGETAMDPQPLYEAGVIHGFFRKPVSLRLLLDALHRAARRHPLALT